jgi:hypothetical protein
MLHILKQVLKLFNASISIGIHLTLCFNTSKISLIKKKIQFMGNLFELYFAYVFVLNKMSLLD